MAIPKKIHYVWVGGQDKATKIKKCMKTWKKHLNDYEIIEWNEKNFDINIHPYVKKAYENRKWAFVSDYIRAYVIYNEGGIYFDTDVIVIDKIDDLLQNKAFVGFESENYPFTAVFGAEAKHPLLKKILDYYDKTNASFKFQDNNTISVSKILLNEFNCSPKDEDQLLESDIKVYNSNILCNPSLNSKTIHAFSATWINKKELGWKLRIMKFLRINARTKFRVRIYLFILKFIGKIKGR